MMSTFLGMEVEQTKDLINLNLKLHLDTYTHETIDEFKI